jgi:hypothetical protein
MVLISKMKHKEFESPSSAKYCTTNSNRVQTSEY